MCRKSVKLNGVHAQLSYVLLDARKLGYSQIEHRRIVAERHLQEFLSIMNIRPLRKSTHNSLQVL